ncbi:MAG: hypothetical protein H6625_09640 [Bdellovibrionaceae bacterium]|nr:hypothetical protein [Pseudobdellovibrionaceae bacterium]
MKKLTKLGLLAALLASLSLFTACSSKEKAQEENAEQALVEQTQDMMADNEPVFEEESAQETPDIEDSASSYSETTAPIADESDLGATSSGLGH